MYHNIGKKPGFNTVSQENLEQQLNWVRERFRVVGLDRYVSELRAGEMEPETVAVTYDDAYLSYPDLALPVMEKLNIPSTLFVPAGLIGKWNTWDQEIAEEKLYILDKQEIQALAEHELVEIGSHGMDHRSMGKLEGDDLEKEVALSREILENVTGGQIFLFSFPYGQMWDFSPQAIKLLIKHGYQAACSTRYGRKNKLSDLYQLKRIEVTPGDSLESFARKCRSGMHTYGVKSRAKEMLHSLGIYSGRKK